MTNAVHLLAPIAPVGRAVSSSHDSAQLLQAGPHRWAVCDSRAFDTLDRAVQKNKHIVKSCQDFYKNSESGSNRGIQELGNLNKVVVIRHWLVLWPLKMRNGLIPEAGGLEITAW